MKKMTKLYTVVALVAVVLQSAGVHAMQPKTSSAQLWYQSQMHKDVQKLNTSFAQLIGAAQDFESRENIKKYVEQTRNDLDVVHKDIKQCNWCPGLIDQAVSLIKDKLVVSQNTAWTGSYVRTGLAEQFTHAQEMKNWLLFACNQAETKKESVEYGKLQLMWLKKDFHATRDSLKKEKNDFERSYEYFDMRDTLKDKQKNKELSLWSTLRLNYNLACAGVNELVGGEPHSKKQEEQYKEELLNQEIQTLEDTLQPYAARLSKLSENYSKNFNVINSKQWNYHEIKFSKDGAKEEVKGLVSPLTACLTPQDEVVFKDKQGNYNKFFDVIWQLCNVKSRQDILIGEKYLDSFSPVAYVCDKVGSIFVGYDSSDKVGQQSLGEKISTGAKIADRFFVLRDWLGAMPLAVGCKCFSMLLALPLLRDAVEIAGVGQDELDALVKIKSDLHEYGFSLNDTLKFSELINDDRLSLIIRLCMKAISKQPEKFARNFDAIFARMGEYMCTMSKTAGDEHALLSYLAHVNKNTYVAPIRAIVLPEPTFIESLYGNVMNKKTLAAVGLAGIIYGSYRSGAPKWILRKSQEIYASGYLTALGMLAYGYVKK